MARRQDIEKYLDSLLGPEQFKDYGPNGLQVEGREQIELIVSGVTASQALIDAAIERGAHAILVHHGLFWRGHEGRLTGWLAQRVRRLMVHGVNLYAYHLPLDAHPELGNNAQLARILGLRRETTFGDQALGFIGDFADPASPRTAQFLRERTSVALSRQALLVPGDGRDLKRIAWCTGGAQGYFEAAIAAGADAFITGEISEPQAHLARETGVAYLACGHHATERYGVQAVAAQVAQQLGLQHAFIDVDNPA